MDLIRAEGIARFLMQKHGPHAWRFKWLRPKHAFGRANYTKQLIMLSKPLAALNEKSRVRNTILHEIAHALLPRGTNHSKVWSDTAKSIGSDGKQYCDSRFVVTPKHKFVGICPDCQAKIFRHVRRFNGIHRGCSNRIVWKIAVYKEGV